MGLSFFGALSSFDIVEFEFDAFDRAAMIAARRLAAPSAAGFAGAGFGAGTLFRGGLWDHSKGSEFGSSAVSSQERLKD